MWHGCAIRNRGGRVKPGHDSFVGLRLRLNRATAFERRARRRDDAGRFERVGDAQRDVLAPRRGDDLHADRERPQRHRHRDHRQPDEGHRLGVEAEVRAHRQQRPVDDEGLLPDQRRRARRRRREDRVDLAEQRQHALAIPAAEFLCRGHHRGGNHRAGDQPVAHGGIVVGGARAQPVEMQRGALGRGDDVSGGARPRHFRHLDFARHAERRRDLDHRRRRFRRHPVAEIAAGDRDAQAVDAARKQRQRRLHRRAGRRRDRRHRGPAWRRSSPRGRRRCARTARDDRSSTRRESCAARDSRP